MYVEHAFITCIRFTQYSNTLLANDSSYNNLMHAFTWTRVDAGLAAASHINQLQSVLNAVVCLIGGIHIYVGGIDPISCGKNCTESHAKVN